MFSPLRPLTADGDLSPLHPLSNTSLHLFQNSHAVKRHVDVRRKEKLKSVFHTYNSPTLQQVVEDSFRRPLRQEYRRGHEIHVAGEAVPPTPVGAPPIVIQKHNKTVVPLTSPIRMPDGSIPRPSTTATSTMTTTSSFSAPTSLSRAGSISVGRSSDDGENMEKVFSRTSMSFGLSQTNIKTPATATATSTSTSHDANTDFGSGENDDLEGKTLTDEDYEAALQRTINLVTNKLNNREAASTSLPQVQTNSYQQSSRPQTTQSMFASMPSTPSTSTPPSRNKIKTKPSFLVAKSPSTNGDSDEQQLQESNSSLLQTSNLSKKNNRRSSSMIVRPSKHFVQLSGRVSAAADLFHPELRFIKYGTSPETALKRKHLVDMEKKKAILSTSTSTSASASSTPATEENESNKLPGINTLQGFFIDPHASIEKKKTVTRKPLEANPEATAIIPIDWEPVKSPHRKSRFVWRQSVT